MFLLRIINKNVKKNGDKIKTSLNPTRTLPKSKHDKYPSQS